MRTIHRTALAALLVAAPLGAHPAAAQTFHLPTATERGISLEMSHPNFKAFDVTLPTTVWFVSGQIPLGQRLRATADLPFAYAKADSGELSGESSSVLGNPQLGLTFQATPTLSVEVGTRLPLNTADAESFADVIGFLTDPQRGEAFADEVVPVSGAVTWERGVASRLNLRARGAVTTALYTGDDEDGSTESLLDYGVFASYTLGMARLGAGFSGRWMASADEGNFGDNSLHQLSMTADVGVGPVRPGIAVRLPVDRTFREVMGSSVGMYLQVPLR